MKLEAIILGSGTSSGVPRLGGPGGAGDWGACDPTNPKNRRRRCSLLVRRREETGATATTVLVDTSPDLREQLLAVQVGHVDGVLMTHAHADQTHGIDDLRFISYGMGKRVDFHADAATLETLMGQFAYCFASPEGSDYPPILTGHAIAEPFGSFHVEGPGGAIPVRAFWQQHGAIRSLGYRFGNIAYSSDVSKLDDLAFSVLEGASCWIVDALRYRSHSSHANVETALSWIARVKPKRAILTNLHMDLDYEVLRHQLPPGVEPAFDGMRIEVDSDNTH